MTTRNPVLRFVRCCCLPIVASVAVATVHSFTKVYMHVRSRRGRRRHRRRRPRRGRVTGGGGAASWRGARCSEPAGCVGNT